MGWYVKGSNTITQAAAVQYDGDNGYLHFEAAMNADQSYNLFGISKNIANAVKSESTVTAEKGCFGKASNDIVVKNSTYGNIIIPFDKDNTTVTELANGDSIEYAMQFALPQGAANGPSVEIFSGSTNKGYLFAV